VAEGAPQIVDVAGLVPLPVHLRHRPIYHHGHGHDHDHEPAAAAVVVTTAHTTHTTHTHETRDTRTPNHHVRSSRIS
jgi:hypothetical protein